MILTREQAKRRLEELNERLALYKQKERALLSDDGVQSYTIGNRTVSRYQYSSNIMDQIKKIEDERDELENLLAGRKPRKVIGVVPRDW